VETTDTTNAEHPCAECGEPTLNEKLCRSCDIEQLLERNQCTECGRQIWNENALYMGMQPLDHTAECVTGRDDRLRGEGMAIGWARALGPKPEAKLRKLW
jgi:hypothetical protein